MRKSRFETRGYDLPPGEEIFINGELLMGWLESMRKWFVPVAFPFVLLFSYAYRVVQALLYGLFALMFAQTLNPRLTYSAGISIAIVAVTPVILLKTLFWIVGNPIPTWIWWMACLAVAMGYIWFGVSANAEKVPKITPGSPPELPPQ
jgi:hypothetical protein